MLDVAQEGEEHQQSNLYYMFRTVSLCRVPGQERHRWAAGGETGSKAKSYLRDPGQF